MINKPTSTFKTIIIFLGLTLCFIQARADTDSQEKDELPSIKALERFDSPRNIISNQVVRFADWVDTFFAGDRAYDELQGSYIKLYLLQTNLDHEKPAYDTKLKAKLVFPKTQKRLKLLIERDEEEDEDLEQQSIAEAVEENDTSIGLRFIQKESKLWRVHTDALLRYRSGIETVARLRLRRRFVNGPWIYRFSENIFWNSTDGAGETTRMDVDHTLSDKFLLRSSTHATWENKNGYFNYGQDFLLFQNISKRKALTYWTGIRAVTDRKPHTTNYILSVRYREQVHKGWLFYEVSPQINYPIEEDHKPVKSISLKLEIVFSEN